MRRMGNRSRTAVLYCAVLYIVLYILFSAVCFANTTVSYADTGEELITGSTNRAPLKGSAAFDPSCVTDRLHWVENTASLGESLRGFYSATGVQPYVYLKSYDATLNSASQKDRWAREYYNSDIKKDNGFLFVYFAEKNQDVDVGYMCCVNGSAADSVMDSEATDIFMQYLKRYWYTDLSTDEVFTKTFENTAKSIMMPAPGFFGTVTIAVIVIILLLICIFAVKIIMANKEAKKRQEIRARKYSRERQNRSTSLRSGLLPFDDTDYSGKKK